MSEYTKSIEPWLNSVTDCECGQRHVVALRKVAIEAGALQQVPDYIKERGIRHATLIGDARTLAVAGERLAELLRQSGIACAVCRIDDNERGEVIADEQAIVQLLLGTPPETEALVAVGAGTLHDIVRFAAHRTGRPFVSVPTAPSVDGFASAGAPLIVRGFKRTIPACSPEAIFADLDVLAAAPQEMIAAGFADLLGKYTSLADWRLGRLLMQERYCPLAADVTAKGLKLCVERAGDIAAALPHGVGRLMEGLILSGISMLMMGHSRPASGSEHHLSHFWEMRWLREKRRAQLHGAKVGVACVRMAELYRRIREMPPEEAASRLRHYEPPTQEEEIARIRRAFGSIWPEVVKENFPAGTAGAPSVAAGCSDPTARDVERNWPGIVDIAESVPTPSQLADWLRQAGGPVSTEQLGIEDGLVQESLASAFYVRNRYTVLRLNRMLQ